MRISVECGGYAEAAATCRTANHLAALLTESLAGKLSGYAGMAGDDATSRDFASSYDAGAREALAALTDLTHAHISMGRLIDACGNRHATADASAAGLPTNAYVGTSLDEDSYARVSPDVPPSSVGPQEPALSRVDAWILDQVEGFLWPGADVDLLRDAAATWRRTSESVADLTDHHRIVADLLARQRSPEIPLAIETIGELRGLVLDVADQLASLASACEDYAAAVADARDRTRALLTEIAQMVVEEVTVTAIVAGITGGLGGSAKAAAAVARIRAQAPRFHALLTTLRAAVAAAASRLRAAEARLQQARASLTRFVRRPVRDERGSFVLPGGGRTSLEVQEHLGGHVISRHVGMSVDDLAARAASERLRYASSFIDHEDAERLLEHVLRSRRRIIDDWLDGKAPQIRIDADLNSATGISVDANGVVSDVEGVRVILRRDPAAPGGYRVLTAFPQPLGR